MTLLFGAIISFVLSINSGEFLDCAYVHSPIIGLPDGSLFPSWDRPIVFALNTCNVENIINAPDAYTFTCVAGDVYVTLWDNTDECDASVSPISYQQIESATEFNCDSSNECNSVVWETYYRAQEAGCVSTGTLISRLVLVVDMCVADTDTGTSVQYLQNTCDHELGIATQSAYNSANCTGPPLYNDTVSSNGTCVLGIFVIANCQIVIATTAEPIATTTTTSTITTTTTIDSESDSDSDSDSESESGSDSAEVAFAILNKGHVDDFAHSRDDTVNIELNFLGFMDMNIWMVFASIFVLNVVCGSVYICYTQKGNKDAVAGIAWK